MYYQVFESQFPQDTVFLYLIHCLVPKNVELILEVQHENIKLLYCYAHIIGYPRKGDPGHGRGKLYKILGDYAVFWPWIPGEICNFAKL